MWFHLNGELFWLASMPYWVLLISAVCIRRRRGFGVYLALAAVVLLLLSDIVHWIINWHTTIPLSIVWQEGGGFVYGLAMTLYQTFPMGLLYLYSRCNDNSVQRQGHVIRGRFNPHELAHHNGKRWLILSAISFILPFGLLTGPLGATHTWWRMHGMDMGRVNPRGRGLLAVAQVIFAMSWLSGYFLLSVAICGFQFYSAEILSFVGLDPILPPFWESCLFYFPSALMAMSFWQAMLAVAFYRRRYANWALLGQLVSILMICGGIIWQVISSQQSGVGVSPAVVYSLQGIWIVVVGWAGWAVSLLAVHQVPEVDSSVIAVG
ncbi:MAG: hypothetical protein CMJ76_01575 [Planctomycetaceae bacterium]|nr:hypothetical protein [Planctomycetaceae bacterium]